MKKNVLFLCTQNSCHSQMAEGLLRHFSGNEYNVYSAGVKPVEINQNAIKVMQEIGIDISKQKSKSINSFTDKKFDIIVAIGENVKEDYPSFLSKSEILHWDFIDPSEGLNYQQYLPEAIRELRDQIKDKIQKHFAK